MRKLRSEQEIMTNWKGDLSKLVVSVCCITYNHESYIEDALEGFLIQETDFPFEIIIHDDASTDKTSDIICEYASAYPNIIKPILQTQNQYSQRRFAFLVDIFEICSGEYIALCEADDYWISPEKLQTQINLMKQYPDINISFHPSYKVDCHELKKNKIFSNHSKDIKIFTPEEVIEGDGGFMPTQSLIIKASVLKKLPDWFKQFAPVGDYYIQMISAIDKGALYIPSPFSVYRVNIAGSWSSSQKNKIKLKKWLYEHFKALNDMNYFYNYIYQEPIKRIFSKYLLNIMKDEFFSIKEKRTMYKEFESLILEEKKYALTLLAYFPSFIILFLRKLKGGTKKCAG